MNENLRKLNEELFEQLGDLHSNSEFLTPEQKALVAQGIFNDYLTEREIIQLDRDTVAEKTIFEARQRKEQRVPTRFRRKLLPWKWANNAAADLSDERTARETATYFIDEYRKLEAEFPRHFVEEPTEESDAAAQLQEPPKKALQENREGAQQEPSEEASKTGQETQQAQPEAEAAPEAAAEQAGDLTPLEVLSEQSAEQDHDLATPEKPAGEHITAIAIDTSDEDMTFRVLAGMFPNGPEKRRIKYVDLATELGVTAEVVRYNTKKLLKAGYIVSHGEDGYEPTAKVIFTRR